MAMLVYQRVPPQKKQNMLRLSPWRPAAKKSAGRPRPKLYLRAVAEKNLAKSITLESLKYLFFDAFFYQQFWGQLVMLVVLSSIRMVFFVFSW